MNNDPNKEWVMEAKDGEQLEEGSDPFLAKSRAKKEAIQVRHRSLPPSLYSFAAHTRHDAEPRQTRRAQQTRGWQGGGTARDSHRHTGRQADEERNGVGVCAAQHCKLRAVR